MSESREESSVQQVEEDEWRDSETYIKNKNLVAMYLLIGTQILLCAMSKYLRF